MNLLNVLRGLTPRKAMLAGAIFAAACGGGGGGGGPSPSISFQSTSVNPSTVEAGKQFSANAQASYSDCTDPSIRIKYGVTTDSGPGASRQANFNAVLGQGVVNYDGYCGDAHASATKPLTVTQPPVASVDSRNLLLTPNNPVSGNTYTASGQGVGVNMQADSVEGIAPDGARRVVRGPASTIIFNQTYTAAQSGTFRLITYGNGVKPDTATAVLTVRAPSTPVIDPIPDATIVEDDSASTALSATNCTNPVWSLGTPNNPNYTPSLNGAALKRKFTADSSGAGSVPVGVTCNEGTATPVNANLAVTAQPDLTITLEEIAGGIVPANVQVRANGQTYTVQNGSKIQLQTGQNDLQLVTGQNGLLELASWNIAGQKEVPLNLNLTSYNINLGSGDLLAKIVFMRSDHPEYSGQSRIDIDAAYIGAASVSGVTGFAGDTNTVIRLRRIQTPIVVAGTTINATMTQGSYDAWGAVFDSIRVDDSVAAAATGRPRRTFIIDDYNGIGPAPQFKTYPNGALCPLEGNFYVYDITSGTPSGGACLDALKNIQAGVASVVRNSVDIEGKQSEAAVWSDGARSDDAVTDANTRNFSGTGNIPNSSRRSGDVFYNKFIRVKADALANLGYGNLKLH